MFFTLVKKRAKKSLFWRLLKNTIFSQKMWLCLKSQLSHNIVFVTPDIHDLQIVGAATENEPSPSVEEVLHVLGTPSKCLYVEN